MPCEFCFEPLSLALFVSTELQAAIRVRCACIEPRSPHPSAAYGAAVAKAAAAAAAAATVAAEGSSCPPWPSWRASDPQAYNAAAVAVPTGAVASVTPAAGAVAGGAAPLAPQPPPPVMILFSGGVDSVLLAALAHRALPLDFPIGGLPGSTVGTLTYQGGILRKSSVSCPCEFSRLQFLHACLPPACRGAGDAILPEALVVAGSTAEASLAACLADLCNVCFDGGKSPDRGAARCALRELAQACPGRPWRLLEVDATLEDVDRHKCVHGAGLCRGHGYRYRACVCGAWAGRSRRLLVCVCVGTVQPAHALPTVWSAVVEGVNRILDVCCLVLEAPDHALFWAVPGCGSCRCCGPHTR